LILSFWESNTSGSFEALQNVENFCQNIRSVWEISTTKFNQYNINFDGHKLRSKKRYSFSYEFINLFFQDMNSLRQVDFQSSTNTHTRTTKNFLAKVFVTFLRVLLFLFFMLHVSNVVYVIKISNFLYSKIYSYHELCVGVSTSVKFYF
jgi:hypothetical protein